MLQLVTLATLALTLADDPIDRALREAVLQWQQYHSPTVELWIDHEGALEAHQQVRVHLRSEFNAYMTVFRVDTDGRVQVLFPGTPWRNNWVRAGREYEIRPGPQRHTFVVDDYPGQGYLFAVSSPIPFRYADYVSGEEWDFRYVGRDGRLEGDPYEALMDLIDAIVPDADAAYDYDVLPYDVGERHDYPRFLCYDCHSHRAFPAWNPYQHSCTRVRMVIYTDPYYYPARVSRSTRVVFSRPRRLEPRFVFKHRSPDIPYIVRERRRLTEETEARRPSNQPRDYRPQFDSVPTPTLGDNRTGRRSVPARVGERSPGQTPVLGPRRALDRRPTLRQRRPSRPVRRP